MTTLQNILNCYLETNYITTSTVISSSNARSHPKNAKQCHFEERSDEESERFFQNLRSDFSSRLKRQSRAGLEMTRLLGISRMNAHVIQSEYVKCVTASSDAPLLR